jgi:hypothetical protein
VKAPAGLVRGLAAIWLGGALFAAGDLIGGLGRLASREVSQPPARLAAGLDLIRSCAARLPVGDDLTLWSTAGPAEPEAFGFLWTLVSYREFPRAVAPLFPVVEIDGLEEQRLLATDLAAHLRDRLAVLIEQPAPGGFVAWSDRADDPPRCSSFPVAGRFAPVESNAFGVCCILQEELP